MTREGLARLIFQTLLPSPILADVAVKETNLGIVEVMTTDNELFVIEVIDADRVEE